MGAPHLEHRPRFEPSAPLVVDAADKVQELVLSDLLFEPLRAVDVDGKWRCFTSPPRLLHHGLGVALLFDLLLPASGLLCLGARGRLQGRWSDLSVPLLARRSLRGGG